MIVGNIAQLAASRLELPTAIYQVLETLKGIDFAHHPDGEMHQQDVVYKTFQATTAPSQARVAETHRDNIDVQFVISGQERVEYRPVLQSLPDDPHPEQDNYFYRSKVGTEKDLVLTPGDFVILFPWDIHAPLCLVEHEAPVRKVVAKVPVRLLHPTS